MVGDASKIMVATPFYEVKGYSPYITSLLNSAHILYTLGIKLEFLNHSGDSYVDRAKNTICAKFLESDCDSLLMIDSDMEWPMDAIVSIVLTPYELTGGAYPVKNNWEHYGVIINTDDEGRPIVDPVTGLISAQWVPGGFLHIKRSCLEKMIEAYPDNWYGDTSADPNSPHRRYYQHFECKVEDHKRYGEDIMFCRKWTEIGGKIWIEPRITFGHHGVKAWYGNYHDFLMKQPGGCNYIKPNPLVSIVITCYNYGQYLSDAIESALNQTHLNCEIIVINDGSTDDTLDITKKYQRIRVINQDNQGVTFARETGMRESNGDWIIMLDADDKLAPDYIEKCLTINDADIVSTAIQEFGDSDRLAVPGYNPQYTDFLKGNQIHCASLFKRKIWETIGGWDPELIGHEDWDFWVRATRNGFSVRTIPEPLFFYRKHGESMVDRATGDHRLELIRKIMKKQGLEITDG